MTIAVTPLGGGAWEVSCGGEKITLGAPGGGGEIQPDMLVAEPRNPGGGALAFIHLTRLSDGGAHLELELQPHAGDQEGSTISFLPAVGGESLENLVAEVPSLAITVTMPRQAFLDVGSLRAALREIGVEENRLASLVLLQA